jgi:transcriptional regulator with XRE-family HTH domain
MENMTIAERIQARLTELGKNASAVALEAGLSRSAVLDILRGKAANPRLDTLQKLTGPLECSLEYLAGADTDPGASPQSWRQFALLDTSVTTVAGVLETGVFRESVLTPTESEDAVLYRDPRQPKWSADLYLIGDETLSGVDIRKGDFATVVVPDGEDEVILRTGLVVAVRRELKTPHAYEHSARMVEIRGNEAHFVSRPSSGSASSLVVDLSDKHPGDHIPFLRNRYYLKDGGYIEITGVVARITRTMPI